METDNEIINQEPLSDNTESDQFDVGHDQNVIQVEELLPSLRTIGDESISRLESSLPAAVTDSVCEGVQELLGDQPDHSLMTTNFEDYTVTEGLLLIISLILFLNFFLSLVRRWF